ncbi:hypothetical protein Poli38472_009381 [Pythium oligandrum]|uniref:Uncharacterized protein n=1 Tax=Pythium oligandrum TaxID=41045 RepID=A0A8K1CKI3_PYTOL|nr:hypothetical protein Poli38472_009381 [Pythium oligandrum]|eukprot:TMW65214.1 hypothetical protein Poli38472_009381 [Pythium oligandrum]
MQLVSGVGVFADPDIIQVDIERSRFCIGNNGCVCMSICESRLYIKCKQNAVAFAVSNDSIDGGSTGNGTWTVIGAVFGALAIALVVAAAVYRRRSRASSSGNDDSASSQTITPTSAPAPDRSLNLFGWQSMRQNLIDKEHAELNGLDTITRVTPFVQFDNIVASAPDADLTAMASAPDPLNHFAVAASAPDVNFALDVLPSAPSFGDEDMLAADSINLL